jgi:hypothetical protein
MKLASWKRLLTWIPCLCLLIAVAGCDGTNGQITFLDFIDTILLGITAAGGIAIIQNV